ncbi:DNA replication protein [Streptococcus agalactiae MRI Z1-024]|uniref:DnaD domain-containing protein n=1 Tax=Streptococcus agalactiae TaxID=1311 RepID=UPI0002B97190|nr:DnaD domain protein [Streptococcus agalactiae]EPV00972.1 DNA replication protein [Streptococcus agalactiae GB00300]EPW23410.1 DNA replication protein [Streptococcus agalactiae CCUG 37739]EPW97598.1 DNA replication protein [Streptococcus agalactiae MRI Z1-022]EQA30005.1 DNA replication protein [Streptococcus agalactiae MRI Z1-024]MCH9565220.1 DnaD domain protein [Streptococcus agalactiae]
MAQRRMFSKKITDTDRFLDMPLSSQALYFHLNMGADDEGFIDKAKTIQRTIGASDDDMKLLIAKGFIIPFDSGVVVIRHWRIHNYIRSDRFQSTIHQDEKKQIDFDATKTANIKPSKNVIPNGYQMDTQVRLDKDRLDKDRLDKDREETIFHFVENEFGRLLSPMEIETIGIMIKENNPDLVKEAIKRTKLQGKTNLNYASGILRNWRDDNITTIEQVEAKEKSRKSKQEEVSEYDTW